MQIHKNEIKTGLLVLVTLGIFVAVLVVIGAPGFLRPLNTYRVYFDNGGGIRPGAPVLLAGRQIGTVTTLHSPVPLKDRPAGHTNYEVAIEVKVDRQAQIYHTITVHLTQQGLMGQQVIDFIHGDETSELATNHTEFVGERVPEITESVTDQIQRLTGEGSDLSIMIGNAKEMTDTLKHEPWRLFWKGTKDYPDDDPKPKKKD